jgi:chemotaxis protein CheC
MNSLTELEMDALKEIFNIGIGRSAAAMNQMVSQAVELSIPEVKLLRNEEVKANLIASNSGKVSAVTQDFRGDFTGQALLMFTQSGGLILVRRLLGNEIPLESLSDLEEDALLEISNIILNACFGTVINSLKADIEIDMPRFQQGTVEEVYPHVSQNDWSLYIEVKFNLPTDQIEGYISFLMDIRSLEVFGNSVRSFVAGLTAV